MSRQTFVITGVAVPFLMCTIVPMVIFGSLYGQWGTNLVWGLVFGFGGWVAQSAFGPEHSLAACSVGLFIWIPIVLGGLFLLSRKIWLAGNEQIRRAFLLLLSVSCLPIVPAETAMSLYANARVPPDVNILMASW